MKLTKKRRKTRLEFAFGKKRAEAFLQLRDDFKKQREELYPKPYSHKQRGREVLRELLEIFALEDEDGMSLADEVLMRTIHNKPEVALKFLQAAATLEVRENHHADRMEANKKSTEVFAPIIITMPQIREDTTETTSADVIDALSKRTEEQRKALADPNASEETNTSGTASDLSILLSKAKDVVSKRSTP